MAGRVPGEARVAVAPEQLPAACGAIATRLGARLATMVGEDDRATAGRIPPSLRLRRAAGGWATVEAAIPAEAPSFPSVTPVVPAAHWYEREVQDLLGLVPEGHPDPRRLVLHDDWPEGVYPLRKDFDPAVPVPRVAGEPHRFHHLHGEGIVEIPVGPIHAGVIEPGHFRFAAVGEVILHLETRLFYTHRGHREAGRGEELDRRRCRLAERICGACACSHAVAYCQAIESIAGVTIPPRAAALRTLCLELERLYNHVGDLGNICAGVGFAVGASLGARLKEELQRLNERLIGNRFLRGVCRIGGVRRDLSRAAVRDARPGTDAARRSPATSGDFVALHRWAARRPSSGCPGTGVLPTAGGAGPRRRRRRRPRERDRPRQPARPPARLVRPPADADPGAGAKRGRRAGPGADADGRGDRRLRLIRAILADLPGRPDRGRSWPDPGEPARPLP